MSPFYKTGLLLFALLALVSCSDEGADYSACFGGVVTNPRAPYVVLSRNNAVIDTIALTKDNRFFVKFDSLTPGLYSFKHGSDYQYVYFDKNDSLMVSINTANFDESIVFSGRGERKNNFMMELYLLHEHDRREGYGIYDRDYKQYQKAVDSAYALRKAFYEKKKAEIQWSKDFDFYANARLNLNYYTKKEYYPYVHARRTGKQVRSGLPANFYAFRKEVDFNNPKLTNFSPFVRYITAMLNNMAIERSKGLAENALRDNIAKLHITDSIFTNEAVKNEVLNNVAFAYLLEDQNIINNKKFLEEFAKISTDSSRDNKIKRMGEAIEELKKGNKIPEVPLVDNENIAFDINDDVNSQTVIFFWTACARTRLEAVYQKVAALKDQHPDVDFIAVNVDSDKEWKSMLRQFPFEDAEQLRTTNFDTLRDRWVFNKINRTIILNPDGTIKNAFTDLMDNSFASYLK